MSTIHLTALDGSRVEYKDERIGQGAMKDVYFSPDRTYVVAFFRDARRGTAAYAALRERLIRLTGEYRNGVFEQAGGAYWEQVFCWPQKVVEEGERIGIVVPSYPAQFFFQYGSKDDDFLGIRGQEKEGKWFASARNRHSFLDPRELGTLPQYLRICLHVARALRRMHAAGLAHSDLSYKNVLVDPLSGSACLIDLDGLVVPGMYPPDVIGTPDFIAPEVLATQHLPLGDPNRVLPSRFTDQHAFAVLVYLYLLFRHPLRGRLTHDMDPQRDEVLAMGEKALFIEHPTDPRNRPDLAQARPAELPWADVTRMPCTMLGPYLTPLLERAFVTGLHAPPLRPTAGEWEQALVKTSDLLQPCGNTACTQRWYIFDNTARPCCPYCGTAHTASLPVLDLYAASRPGVFTPEQHRIMVYHGQNLYPWHVNRDIFPNERLSNADRVPVADFQLLEGRWHLINRRLPGLRDVGRQQAIPAGTMIALEDGMQLLLSQEEGGRLARVMLVGA
jgi:serine/threonine protein kinase